jgi:hypothetical protein
MIRPSLLRLAAIIYLAFLLSDAAGADNRIPTKISRWVGQRPEGGIYLKEGYLYLGKGPGFSIIDIADPTLPIEISQIELDGVITGIVVKNSYAFVAASRAGLYIIDVSEISHPVVISVVHTEGIATGIAVTEVYAYLSTLTSGIHIVDISDPRNPHSIGTYTEAPDIYELYIEEGIAYCAAGDSGLHIVDVRDPNKPEQLSVFATHGTTRGIRIAGGYAYATAKYGFHIIDIANPYKPDSVGFHSTDPFIFETDKIHVVDNYVYLAYFWYFSHSSQAGYYIIDVSHPGFTKRISDWPTLSGIHGGNVMGFHSGDSIAVVAVSSGNTQLLDITQPGEPVLKGVFNSWQSPTFMRYYNSHIYGVAENLFRIIDVSSPGSPVQRGFTRIGGVKVGIDISGNYAFVANVNSKETIIYNINNPTAPQEVGKIDLFPLSISISDGFAYMGANGDLYVYDISNIATPQRTRHMAMGWSNIYEIYIQEGYAYIAAGDFCILSLQFRGYPQIRSCLGLPETAYSVTVTDNYAYVASLYGSLYIIDVEDPSNPQVVSSLIVAEYIYQIYINRDVVYLAAIEDGLILVDVSDPENPEMAGLIDISALSVTGHNDFIYVSNTLGISIYKIASATSVSDRENKITGFFLEQNFPNPFNPVTTIRYAIPEASHVRLTIFDAIGREVVTLMKGYQLEGTYTIDLDASPYPSGIYYYRIDIGSSRLTRRMTLLK